MQWRIALQSLRMNRVRTGLTTLGIIIGVASITLVLSLGGGAESTVRQQVARLGNNVILVKSGYSSSRLLDMDSYNPYGIAITTSLTATSIGKLPEPPAGRLHRGRSASATRHCFWWQCRSRGLAFCCYCHGRRRSWRC